MVLLGKSLISPVIHAILPRQGVLIMENEEKILALLEQLQKGQEVIQEDIKSLKSDMKVVKKKVEFTAVVLEGTIKMVDELDQKWRAM